MTHFADVVAAAFRHAHQLRILAVLTSQAEQFISGHYAAKRYLRHALHTAFIYGRAAFPGY